MGRAIRPRHATIDYCLAQTQRKVNDSLLGLSVADRVEIEGPPDAGEVRRLYGRCQAMVMSSVMEGGANVVSEAIVAGLPVLASDISGNRGLLGDRHPAYYPVEDTQALARLLWRAEDESGFLESVQAHADTRKHLFTPQREREAWASLLAELG